MAVECQFCDNYEEIFLEQLIMSVKNEKTIQKSIERIGRNLSCFFRKTYEEENTFIQML